MKKIVFLIVFGSAMCGFTFAQSPPAELEKVKEIKLLESKRDDVRKILADYSLDTTDNSRRVDKFSTKNAKIEISYSSGNCSNVGKEWNISESKVTKIEFLPAISIEMKNLGLDYSKFHKEKEYKNLSNQYVYHNKDLGIAVYVNRNEVNEITYFPTKKNYLLLCNEQTVRNQFLGKSIFARELKDRTIIIPYKPYYPDVVNLTLIRAEITADCFASINVQNKSCLDDVKQIAVFTKAFAKEPEVFIYYYQVSGGKIVGKGANVIWDLSGAKPGTYTITANADNGCGLCGKSITKTVIVKECPNCSTK